MDGLSINCAHNVQGKRLLWKEELKKEGGTGGANLCNP